MTQRASSILIVLQTQLLLARLSHLVFKVIRSFKGADSGASRAVVGPDEVASIVAGFHKALGPDHASCSLSSTYLNYDFEYTYRFHLPFRALERWLRFILGPIYLGKLSAEYDCFVYVGRGGYLANLDFRRTEAAYLHSLGKMLIQVVTGSDFRSPSRSSEIAKQLGTMGYYDVQFADVDAEKLRQLEFDAKAAADVVNDFFAQVFDFPNDNANWISDANKTPFLYFPNSIIPEPDFGRFGERPITIAHAPSSLKIKGTQFVREAIASLQRKGFDIEYLELTGVSNRKVVELISRSHILVNELFGWSPGVLAVEGLQAGCLVVTRANDRLEPHLPSGSNLAWISAGPEDLEFELEELLKSPDSIEGRARRGHAWFKSHYQIGPLKLGPMGIYRT